MTLLGCKAPMLKILVSYSRPYLIMEQKFQVLWQGHTIQVENGDGNLQAIQTQYSIEFETNVENQEMDVETKPKMEKKAGVKRKKKVAESDSDDEVFGNSLEDNPEQVIVCILVKDI